MPTDRSPEQLAQDVFEETMRPGSADDLAERLLKDAKAVRNPATNPRKTPKLRSEKWIHPSGMVCMIAVQTNSGKEKSDFDPAYRLFVHQRLRRYGGMPYDEAPMGVPPSQWPAVRDLVIKKLRKRHADQSAIHVPSEQEVEESKKAFAVNPEIAQKTADVRRSK